MNVRENTDRSQGVCKMSKEENFWKHNDTANLLSCKWRKKKEKKVSIKKKKNLDLVRDVKKELPLPIALFIIKVPKLPIKTVLYCFSHNSCDVTMSSPEIELISRLRFRVKSGRNITRFYVIRFHGSNFFFHHPIPRQITRPKRNSASVKRKYE
jgi:hypothetical protein